MSKDAQKVPMTPEELEGMLHFRKRAFSIENKKGKGSYRRKKKHRDKYEDD